MRLTLALATGLFVASCAAVPPQPEYVPSQVPPAIEARLREMGNIVDVPRTAALYAPLASKEPYAGVKVTRDAAYGPDSRHRLDVFEPDTQGASRPVLVFSWIYLLDPAPIASWPVPALMAIFCGLVHSAFGNVIRTMPCSKVASAWLASTSKGKVTVR